MTDNLLEAMDKMIAPLQAIETIELSSAAKGAVQSGGMGVFVSKNLDAAVRG
jgi:hypothetical protein